MPTIWRHVSIDRLGSTSLACALTQCPQIILLLFISWQVKLTLPASLSRQLPSQSFDNKQFYANPAIFSEQLAAANYLNT